MRGRQYLNKSIFIHTCCPHDNFARIIHTVLRMKSLAKGHPASDRTSNLGASVCNALVLSTISHLPQPQHVVGVLRSAR